MSEQERSPTPEQTVPEQTVPDWDEEPVYVISVAAKLASLPAWTLRVLDKEGIVCPQRTLKDRRLYSERDLARLARVRYLSEERGVNLSGIKVILEMEAPAPRAARQPGTAGQGETE